MKKILSLVLTLIMLAMLFSACDQGNKDNGKTNNPSVSDIYANYTEEPLWLYQNKTNIPELSGKENFSETYNSYSDSILKAFQVEGDNKTDLYVYNLEKATLNQLPTVDNDDTVLIEFFEFNGLPFFSLIHGVETATTTEFTTTIYNANCEVVATAKGIHVYDDDLAEDADVDGRITETADLFRFDNTIFRVAEDGTATVLKAKSPFTVELPYVEFYNENYYIAYADTYSDTVGFVFYNRSLEVVADWTCKYMYIESEPQAHFLNNGNVLVQIFEKLPDDAQEYDVYTDGAKYNLTTLLIDPATGAEKSIDASFAVGYAYALDAYDSWGEFLRDEYGISDEYENIARIARIEDKKATNYSFVMLDNEGNIVCELFTDLPQMMPSEIVSPWKHGLFCYNTVNGTVVYINANGEKIMETDNDDFYELADYFVIDNAIYDYSFNLVYDFGADGYEIYTRDYNWDQGLGSIYESGSIMSDGILLTKNGAIYLYVDSTPTLIVESESSDCIYEAYDDYYIIRKANQNGDYAYSYYYYNSNGQEFLVSHGRTASMVLYNNEGIALFRAYNVEGKAQYYRVTK